MGVGFESICPAVFPVLGHQCVYLSSPGVSKASLKGGGGYPTPRGFDMHARHDPLLGVFVAKSLTCIGSLTVVQPRRVHAMPR